MLSSNLVSSLLERMSGHSTLTKQQDLSLPLQSCADTYIQKTRKLYMDTRTQRNINKLNEDLTEVHSIMTKNIQDVLGQGERLDSKQSNPILQPCC